MRRLVIIGVLSACLLGGAPLAAMADEKTEKALEERIQKLEKMCLNQDLIRLAKLPMHLVLLLLEIEANG